MKGDKKGRQGDEENEGNANGKRRGEERKIHDKRGNNSTTENTQAQAKEKGDNLLHTHAHTLKRH